MTTRTRSHRILLIDDERSIRDLVVRQLATELPDIEVIPIGDPETQQRAIEAGDFDLVITDYQLEWSDGLTILREVQARYPACPVIMFTGTGNEEIAVQAMKDELYDYILKPAHMVRLSASVRGALEQHKEHLAKLQAETLLARSTATLAALVNSAPVGITILDTEGKVTLWNRAAERIFGWRAAEVIGRPLPTIPPEMAEQHRALREQVLQDRAFTDLEVIRRRKDGTPVCISLSTAPLRDAQGRITGILGIMADISDRKQAEKTLQESQGRLKQF